MTRLAKTSFGTCSTTTFGRLPRQLRVLRPEPSRSLSRLFSGEPYLRPAPPSFTIASPLYSFPSVSFYTVPERLRVPRAVLTHVDFSLWALSNVSPVPFAVSSSLDGSPGPSGRPAPYGFPGFPFPTVPPVSPTRLPFPRPTVFFALRQAALESSTPLN